MKIKELSYAYPSSTMAKKLGFAKTGCYFITTGEEDADYDTRAVLQGFAKRDDAEKAFSQINLPVSFYSMK